MRICGIDISTFSVDFVYLPLDVDADPTEFEHVSMKLRKTSTRAEMTWEGTMRLRELVPVMPQWQDTALAFIERGGGRSQMVNWVLGRVQGALMMTIPDHVIVNETRVQEWKKLFSGNGNASKELVIARGRQLGVELPDDNAYDAYGIAYALRILNARAADAVLR